MLAGVLVLLVGVPAFERAATAQVAPPAVLLLDQSDPNAPWGIEFRASFRSILSARTAPVTLYIELTDLGRFNTPEFESLQKEYLRKKYSDKPIGVLVANGSKMLELALRLREDLWPHVPLVFATVDPETLARINIPLNVTGATIQLTLHGALTVARALVPDLKTLVHVGSNWEEQPFFGQLVHELPAIRKEVEFIDLAGLAMTDIKKRVSALPANSAIIYTSLYIDGAGVQFAPIDAVSAVARAANRPTFVLSERQIGVGVTGGMVALPGPAGRDAANRVSRLLDGEDIGRMPVLAGNFTKPIFDWRQLERFGIGSRALPRDSEIRFRPLTLWELYRWQMTAIFIVVLLQGTMILGLLMERHRRQTAELLSRHRLLEVIHLNRIATAGAMSASIAHELNQPLGAILSNAEAAKNLLAHTSPDIEQIKEIVEDIHRDDQRAADIIRHLRGRLRRNEIELQNFDLREVIASTLQILEPEAAKRGIKLSSKQASENLLVRGNHVHFQQVLLNLAMNGMDAVQSSKGRERELTFEAAINGNSEVKVSISDSGDGIPAESLEGVFEPFFTTKPQGTGLGLSIARTIIESCGGKIWAENRPSGGAAFRFTLPRAQMATP